MSFTQLRAVALLLFSFAICTDDDLEKSEIQTFTCNSFTIQVESKLNDVFLYGTSVAKDLTFLISAHKSVPEAIHFNSQIYSLLIRDCKINTRLFKFAAANIYLNQGKRALRPCRVWEADWYWVSRIAMNRAYEIPQHPFNWVMKLDFGRIRQVEALMGIIHRHKDKGLTFDGGLRYDITFSFADENWCVRPTSMVLFDQRFLLMNGFVYVKFVGEELQLDDGKQKVLLDMDRTLAYTKERINECGVTAYLGYNIMCDPANPCFYSKKNRILFAFLQKRNGMKVPLPIFKPMGENMGFEGAFLDKFVKTLQRYIEHRISEVADTYTGPAIPTLLSDNYTWRLISALDRCSFFFKNKNPLATKCANMIIAELELFNPLGSVDEAIVAENLKQISVMEGSNIKINREFEQLQEDELASEIEGGVKLAKKRIGVGPIVAFLAALGSFSMGMVLYFAKKNQEMKKKKNKRRFINAN